MNTLSTQPTGIILVVDDEEHLRFILNAHLTQAGFHVLTATNGHEALQIAKAELPDVVVMDVSMPFMDGLTATRQFKSDPVTRGIPIIMLTGRSSTNDLVRGLEAGAQEYLSKPFEMAELIARVRTVFNLARSHKQVEELNRKLEEEVERKTRRLQILYDFMRALSDAKTREDILDLVIQCIRDTTGSKRISVMMPDPDRDALVCVRSSGIPEERIRGIQVGMNEGVVGRVFQSGSTFISRALGRENSDRGYTQSEFMSTPLVAASLKSQGESLGVVNITDKNDGRPFTDHEVECICSIVDAGAIALTNFIQRQRLEQSVRVLLRTIGQLSEFRDNETGQHLERVSRYAVLLSRTLARMPEFSGEISDAFIEAVGLAAPMHDLGKIGIPDRILTKPGRLTEQEFEVMKTHTQIGHSVLSVAMEGTGPVPLLQMCIEIAYCHHEKYDGTGYPRGLKGKEIPLSARIIALADAYDAMTSVRRYKEARDHEDALRVIQGEAGRHFDPGVVLAFMDCERQSNAIRVEFADEPEPMRERPTAMIAAAH